MGKPGVKSALRPVHLVTNPAMLDSSTSLSTHVFHYDVDDNRLITVEARVGLTICARHLSKGSKCTVTACDGLHCCRFFLEGRCSFGAKCNLGHELQDSHNHALLVRHHLDGLAPVQLWSLLKPRIQSSSRAAKAWNDLTSNVVQPKALRVCHYHNNPKGCTRGASCAALHMCLRFVNTSNCPFGPACKGGHDVLASQPKSILLMFSLNIHNKPADLLLDIRARIAASFSSTRPTDNSDDGRCY